MVKQCRVRTLFVIVGVLGLGALFWLLTLWIPTDRKQMQENLWAMGRAVLDRKPQDLSKHLAKDFRFQNLSRDEIAKGGPPRPRAINVDSNM